MKNPPAGLYEEDTAVKNTSADAGKASLRVNPYKSVGAWLLVACMFFNCWQLTGYLNFVGNYADYLGYSTVPVSYTHLGLKGSPTNIFRSFTPMGKSGGRMLSGDEKSMCSELAALLSARNLI